MGETSDATRPPLHLHACHLTPLLLSLLLLLPDPFADAEAAATAEEEEETQNVTKGKAYVHVRVQQRNGRKSLTTVQVRVCRVFSCVPEGVNEGQGQQQTAAAPD